MKSENRLLRAGLFFAALLPLVGVAQESPVKPAPAPGAAPAHNQVDRAERANIAAAMYMHRLLSMNDEQLSRSRQVIEKVEKLSPEQRAELRKRLEGLRDAPPAEREKLAVEMREKFGISGDEFRGKDGKPGEPAKSPSGKPGEESRRGGNRNVLEKHWATLAPDAAKAEREKFLAMPREEKVVYIKALREKYGLPPEPERDGKKRSEGERERRREAKPGERSAPPSPPPAGDPFRPQA
jgi:hypothetical protein